MPINKLLDLPYGSYLMVRLDYKLICNDELEAKIMRIIEMYMDIDRMIIYREMLNNPQNTIDPNVETKITKDVWVAISHRLFKNDLYDQDMSENTLKRAIKSLVKKKFIRMRDDRTKRYEAPKYQINTEAVQAELNTLSKLGKTEYQKLMVSKIDGIKNSSHQNMTPADHQNLTVSSNSMVSKFDPNSRRVTNTVKDTEEEGTSREENSTAQNVATATTPARHSQISPTTTQGEHDGHHFTGITAGSNVRVSDSNSPAPGGDTQRTTAVQRQTGQPQIPHGADHGTARKNTTAVTLASNTPPAARQSEQDSVAPELSTSLPPSGKAARAVTQPPSQYQPPARDKGKGKTTKGSASNKVYFSMEGAAFRAWYEELTSVALDETAANARACNILGQRASVTYDNLKLVVKEIRTSKWVKRERVAVTVQDLASEDKMLRWEKWLLSAQQDTQPRQAAPEQKPSDNPYDYANILALSPLPTTGAPL